MTSLKNRLPKTEAKTTVNCKSKFKLYWSSFFIIYILCVLSSSFATLITCRLEYKDKIPQNLYEAMYTYIVEITD